MVVQRLSWQRISNEPFIGPRIGSCASDAVTTPDILVFNGKLLLYTGAVSESQEKIILLPVTQKDIEKEQPLIITEEAKVVLEPGPYDFDCYHVFDPATTIWNKQIFLYYSAIGKDQDRIGLAISNDGVFFEKQNKPILDGRSPEIVINGDIFYLFFVRDNPGQGYSIYLAQSKDGFHFQEFGNAPILTTGPDGDWDDFEVTTPRIFQISGTYYMIYAGLTHSDPKDIPRAFGLARSNDLIQWEKYPHNPIFECAESGSWDEGAIWFGTPMLLDDMIYLFYEGGRLENIKDKSPALTEVGLAKLPIDQFYKGILSW
jgi:predicted GH43/DUF377 family glycosyl hydrolase